MMNLTLVVLAAGLGSRYGDLKQMDGFGPSNETLLEYGVYDALKAGFNKVVFIVRHSFFESFKERIGDKISQKVEVAYVFQEIDTDIPPTFHGLLTDRQKPRGTAHAVLVAKDEVHTPFAVINADDFYGRDAYQQIATFLKTNTPNNMGLVGYVLKNTISPFGSVNRGVCITKDSNLISVHEHLKIVAKDNRFIDKDGEDISANAIVSMNFRGFHPDFFQDLEDGLEDFLSSYTAGGGSEYFIPLAVDTYLKQKKGLCQMMMSHDIRCGVTHPEDKPFVQQHIAGLVSQGIYPTQLRQ